MIWFAVLSVVLLVGWHIPLPSLSLDSILGPSSAVHLSIMALGLTPFFTVLAYLEVAKLAVPPLARWQTASTGNSRYLAIVVLVASLALAAYEGLGVLIGVDASALVRRDAIGFVPAGLATFVGATALIVWLADTVDLPDLGGGFWPMMAIMVLADLPAQIVSLANFARIGQISGGQFFTVVVLLLAGIFLVVFANQLLSGNAPGDDRAKIPMLLWPSYLGSIVAGYVLTLLPSDWPIASLSFADAAYVAVAALFIPVFVFAYAGLLSSGKTRAERWPLPVVFLLSAIQMVLYVGAWALPASLGIPSIIYGGELLVVGTVILALFSSHTPPPRASRRR